jgi:hypothetical protein
VLEKLTNAFSVIVATELREPRPESRVELASATEETALSNPNPLKLAAWAIASVVTADSVPTLAKLATVAVARMVVVLIDPAPERVALAVVGVVAVALRAPEPLRLAAVNSARPGVAAVSVPVPDRPLLFVRTKPRSVLPVVAFQRPRFAKRTLYSGPAARLSGIFIEYAHVPEVGGAEKPNVTVSELPG